MVDGKAIEGPSLDRAVIFQSHALLPGAPCSAMWPMRSRRNGGIGAVPKIEDHAKKFIEKVGLKGSEAKKPAQLSAA